MLKSIVTESGVRLLTTQKPVKRPGWWNGKFALFWMPAAVGVTRRLSKCRLPLLTIREQELLYTEGGGATCRNSTGSSDNRLEIGHQWSDQHHLDCCRDS